MAKSENGEQADPDTLTKLAASIREYAKLLSLIGPCITNNIIKITRVNT